MRRSAVLVPVLAAVAAAAVAPVSWGRSHKAKPAPPASTPATDTARALVAAAIAAAGGPAALRAIHDLTLEGGATVTSPTLGSHDGSAHAVAIPGAERLDLSFDPPFPGLPAITVGETVGPRAAYYQIAGVRTDLTGDDRARAEAAVRYASPDALETLSADDVPAKLVRSDATGDVVEIAAPGAPPADVTLDHVSHLPLRVEVAGDDPSHPAVFDGFRKVSGVPMPMHETFTLPDGTQVELHFTRAIANTGVHASAFE